MPGEVRRGDSMKGPGKTMKIASADIAHPSSGDSAFSSQLI
jgi:hypothetical protein